jgi:hypothetical protein
MKQKLALAIATAILVSGPNAAHAERVGYVNLGGVNLTAWCQKTFGSSFEAKLIGTNAGGWACEQSAGNRRPISVKDACKLQYGKKVFKAEARNWNDPYSWRCLERRAVETYRRVNLTAWCGKTFGSQFKAKLIGTNAGGWACEQSAGNRRPISVKDACTLQYGKAATKAVALKWSDPLSWRCVVE